MQPILVRETMRAFEAHFIERGVPELVLMENAGRGAAHWLGLQGRPRHGEAEKKPRPVGGSCVRCADEGALSGFSVVVLAGPGNNGGDGFVVARHLLGRGATVRVVAFSTAESSSASCRVMRAAFEAIGGEVRELDATSDEERDALFGAADFIVDALWGTGLRRPLEGAAKRLVESVNASGARVVALDVPSGLDADTGEVLGVAVRAEHTVTFAHLKRGLFTTRGHELSGRITVSQIGVPRALPGYVAPSAWWLEERDLTERLSSRSPTSHKSTAGKVAVVGGSAGMFGAPRLSARAAFRGGAGVVTLASDAATIHAFEVESLETMTRVVDDPDAADFQAWLEKQSALVVGPGIGRSEDAARLVRAALAARRPTVVDADALRLIAAKAAGLSVESLRDHDALVLTPHPAEAADLLGRTTERIESDRFGAAEELAARSGAVVVLKGSRTIVAAPRSISWVSSAGSAALATAGSGDVLGGVIAALLAEKSARTTFDSALVGVGLHALAGEAWSEEHGDAGLLASEIADGVPAVRARLLAAI